MCIDSSSSVQALPSALAPPLLTLPLPQVCRRTNSPTYRERFLFALEEEELPHRSLAFYMYASDKFTNTLIGEAHLKLTEVDLAGPFTTTVPLTDMGQVSGYWGGGQRGQGDRGSVVGGWGDIENEVRGGGKQVRLYASATARVCS